MQQITLNVADEVVALAAAVQGLFADIKAGKSAIVDLEDAIAVLVPALGSAMNIGADLKQIDNQAYLARCLAAALEPAAAPVAPGA